MLWEKLALFKDYVIVQMFLGGGGGATHGQGEVWKEDFKFLCESSLQCLCCGKIWIVAKYILEKLAMVKDFVIVQIVNLFLRNTLTARGIWIFEEYGYPMLNLCGRPSQCLCYGKIWILVKYVVEKVVEKVGNGQRLCTCANSPLGGGGGGGTRTQTGEYGKWMLISCERPSQCLCCGRIWSLAKYAVQKVGNGQRLCNCALCK